MSRQGVQTVLGRMVADPVFREDIFADPDNTLRAARLDLTPEEIQAFRNLKPEDFQVTFNRVVGPGGVASFDIDVRTARF